MLFDLDGVLVPTGRLHQQAWRELFEDFLTTHSAGPAYSEADYFELIDGRPRYDGVAAVLASRGIDLPWGDPSDDPSRETVCGLGNRKNLAIERALATGPVTPYAETVPVLLGLLRAGRRLAVVSSSQNARVVLAAAAIEDAFETVLDGAAAAHRRLPGKPQPDTFLAAAADLKLDPRRAVVVEDATFGVAAGRAGGFGLVVGVDRGAGQQALLDAGADIVIQSLRPLTTDQTGQDADSADPVIDAKRPLTEVTPTSSDHADIVIQSLLPLTGEAI